MRDSSFQANSQVEEADLVARLEQANLVARLKREQEQNQSLDAQLTKKFKKQIFLSPYFYTIHSLHLMKLSLVYDYSLQLQLLNQLSLAQDTQEKMYSRFSLRHQSDRTFQMVSDSFTEVLIIVFYEVSKLLAYPYFWLNQVKLCLFLHYALILKFAQFSFKNHYRAFHFTIVISIQKSQKPKPMEKTPEDSPHHSTHTLHQKRRQKPVAKPLHIGNHKQAQIEPFLASVGVLHLIWRNQRQNIQATAIVTAVAISPHLILTCAKNMYYSRQGRYADCFQFVPAIKQGQRPSDQNIYKARLLTKNSFQILALLKHQTQPQTDETSMLFVEKPMVLPPGCSFPKLGNLQQMGFVDEKDRLCLAGFPTEYFQSLKFRDNATFKLVAKEGRVTKYSNSEHLMQYEIKTSEGVSGGPIFAVNQQNETVLVGIHLHSGKLISRNYNQKPNNNFGWYFNDKNQQKIRDLERECIGKRVTQNRQWQRVRFYAEIQRQELLNENGQVSGLLRSQEQLFQKQGHFQKQRNELHTNSESKQLKCLNSDDIGSNSEFKRVQQQPVRQKQDDLQEEKHQHGEIKQESRQQQHQKYSNRSELQTNQQPLQIKQYLKKQQEMKSVTQNDDKTFSQPLPKEDKKQQNETGLDEKDDSDQLYEKNSNISTSAYKWIINQDELPWATPQSELQKRGEEKYQPKPLNALEKSLSSSNI